jgi:hypothetical protein
MTKRPTKYKLTLVTMNWRTVLAHLPVENGGRVRVSHTWVCKAFALRRDDVLIPNTYLGPKS